MLGVGKYVFAVNAASKTLTRLVGTGSNVFVDDEVAASITTGGGPTDVDAAAGGMMAAPSALGPTPIDILDLGRCCTRI